MDADVAAVWPLRLPKVPDAHNQSLTTWFLARRLRRACRPCGQPTGTRLGVSTAELDMARLAVQGPERGPAMPDYPAPQDRPPLDDAQRRDLVEEAGYGSATTPPGDLTSPIRQMPPAVGPDSPLRQGKLKDSWRPGLTWWGLVGILHGCIRPSPDHPQPLDVADHRGLPTTTTEVWAEAQLDIPGS